MRVSSSSLLGGLYIFTTAASALPADSEPAAPQITEPPLLPNFLERRAGPTDAWVEVDDEGRPAKTHTPSYTEVDGTTSVIDGAPHDLTASLFTNTWYGKVSTSTGDPPAPSATNKHTQGAFARCNNLDGENAPLCDPAPSATLYDGSIYYVTWDPDFFNSTNNDDIPANSTIEISMRMDYLNRTSNKEAPSYNSLEDWDDHDFQKLDETDRVPATWGVIPFHVKKQHFKGPSPHNITVTLFMNEKGSRDKNETSIALPLVLDKRTKPTGEENNDIENRDLVIALPVVFGSLLFMLIGVCLWNRKTRRIQLGNIMGRHRHGYTGRSKRRMGKDGGSIRLEEQAAAPLYEYRDDAGPMAPERRRMSSRDSDLGSLAGTPVTPNFEDQGTVGGQENAFRDELRRQGEERRGF